MHEVLTLLRKNIGPQMGLTFDGERVTPDILYPNTLQRFGILFGAAGDLPDIIAEVTAQHLERYKFASKFVAGKRILDIASGCGFGSKIFGDAQASSVIGVDISLAAVKKSEQTYGRNGHFVNANANAIPLESHSVDVVTSFETIEHTSDYDTFLNEVSRVLTPDGVFVVSSPNRTLSSPGQEFHEPLNPYHTQEFTQKEFLELLQGKFADVEVYGQHWTEPPKSDTSSSSGGEKSSLRQTVWQNIHVAKYHAINLFNYQDHAEIRRQDEVSQSKEPVYVVCVCRNPFGTPYPVPDSNRRFSG